MNQEIGNCGFCSNSNVLVIPRYGDKMCLSCAAKEDDAVRATQVATSIVARARDNDDAVVLSQDIFNKATTSITELRGAIFANEAIPQADKYHQFALEIEQRILKLDAVIFAEEEATQKKRNERYAFVKGIQDITAKLSLEHRERFKKYDVTYNPQSPKLKKIKEETEHKKKVAAATTKKFKRSELAAACAKYHVQPDMVALIGQARNVTAEEAAKIAFEALNKKKTGTN